MPGYARQTSTDTSGILATTTVRNVGDSEQLLYTATKKSEVTAIQVANRTGGILPISISLCSISYKTYTEPYKTGMKKKKESGCVLKN